MKGRVNWWRWLCWPVDIAAMVVLQKVYSVPWWVTGLCVLVPAFVNYIDGLWRGLKEGKKVYGERQV